MTPPTTAAAARSANRSAPGSRRSAVRSPRRISGPSSPGRSSAAAIAIPAPGIVLPRQRPLRPVQPRRRPARKTTPRSLEGTPGIALRAIDAVEGISSSAVLDRLIRGRVWIGVLAFALIGIVAMQLLVLEFNTGIGRTLGRVATLQRQNAQLGIEDSMYSAESRVAPLAAAAGMTLAPAGTVHFVAANPVDVSRAATALSTALQTSASGLAGTTGIEGSEAAPTGATSSNSATTDETVSPAESSASASGGGESTAGSSESSSSAGSETGSSASSSSPPAAASTPATTSSSEGGSQISGASAPPSNGSSVPGTEVSGSGGGTQAGPQE